MTMKICLAASAGGHLTELLKLPEVWDGKDHFFVTTSEVVLKKLGNGARAYAVPWANRNHPLLLLRMLASCVNIMRKERPDVVISSGAAVGCLFCILGKLMGKKVVWLELIAFADEISLSGKIVQFFADLFLVQWPELARRYPRARYAGNVL